MAPVTEPHCMSGCGVVALAAATAAQGTSTSSSPTYRTAGWKMRATASKRPGTWAATVSGRAAGGGGGAGGGAGGGGGLGEPQAGGGVERDGPSGELHARILPENGQPPGC